MANDDAAVRELKVVKQLLIVLLLKLGATSGEIAAALGVSGRRARQLVPSRKVKKAEFVK